MSSPGVDSAARQITRLPPRSANLRGMESAGLWLSFVAAAAAIASAVFAYVQAKTATDARKDAKDAEGTAIAARDAAVEAQRDSAANSGRIAQVMEEQAAAARATAAVRPEPWKLLPGSPRRTGKAVVLVHDEAGPITDVSLEIERQPYAVWFDPNPVPTDFEPGDSVEIYYARAGGDPSTSTLVVNWRWADSDRMHVTRAPLM